jgi:serine/threonine-protein kinase HipA
LRVPDELAVLLDGVIVGSLTRAQGTHAYRLRYADDWLGNPHAYPVSLALSLFAPEHEGLVVRHWLRGLLPDNEARLQEIEAEFAVSRDDPYAMLAFVGEDCVGAVQFASRDRAAEIACGNAHRAVEWLDDATLEVLLEQVAARSSPDRRAVRTGQFSLPGALGKVALVWDGDGERWGRPSGQSPSTHILKPPMPGVSGHNENEHFCLQLAREAGLSAAASRMVRIGKQQAIAVERYDRQVEGRGRVRRLHQEDMAQALGLDPSLKYAKEAGAGIGKIVGLLRDYGRPHDVDAFVRGVGCAWITAGTDAHLRNFSVLIEHGQNATLAPLYDVASAFGLPDRQIRRVELRLAMAVGGETLLDDIGIEAWRREARHSRLPSYALSDVARLAERVDQAAPRVAERLGDEDGLDARYLNRLAKKLATRARACAREMARS